MPEPRAPKQDRTVGQQVGSRARQLGRAASRLDVALGPAEVPLGSIIGILAGAAVGIAPAVIFRSGILLPVGLVLGGVAGGVAGAVLRGRLNFRGWRLGVVGVLLLGLLTICFSCFAVSMITGLQKEHEADLLDQWAAEEGLALPQQPPVETPVYVRICWGVVAFGVCLLIVVAGLTLLVKVIRS